MKLAALLIPCLFAGGCVTTEVVVTKSDGTTIRAIRMALGTKAEVGDLAIETPTVKGKLSGYVSDPAAGLQTIDKLVDKIPAR